MRILHLGKCFPPATGGIETITQDLMRAQLEAGHDVMALVHRADRRGTRDEDFHGGTVRRLWTPFWLLYAPIAPTYPIHLDRLVRRFKPDVLHVHVPNTSAFFALRGPARRTPMVVHWHSDVVASTIDRRLGLAYRFYRPLERRLLRQARAIVATSPPYLDASQALAPFRDKCVAVPLGVDPLRLPEPDDDAMAWAVRQWPDIEATTMRALAVGRLTYYKGFAHLIDAAALAPDIRLLIVGSGDQEAALHERITRLGVEDRVRMLGYVPGDRLLALQAATDALVMTSIERTEAFGVVLLEAMRYARPIAAFDIPGSGVGWVVQDGTTGRLVKLGDHEALAAVLQTWAADPDARRELGDAGRRRFEAELDIRRTAEAFDEVYERALRPGSADASASH